MSVNPPPKKKNGEIKIHRFVAYFFFIVVAVGPVRDVQPSIAQRKKKRQQQQQTKRLERWTCSNKVRVCVCVCSMPRSVGGKKIHKVPVKYSQHFRFLLCFWAPLLGRSVLDGFSKEILFFSFSFFFAIFFFHKTNPPPPHHHEIKFKINAMPLGKTNISLAPASGKK